MLQNQSLIPDIKAIIATAKDKAVKAVDNERTIMYWSIGKRIFEEEQQGKDRADYGTYLIKFLSEQLQPEYGTGFSYRQLNWYRQFYRVFPIVSALRTQLSWSQYKLLLAVDNQDKREFNGRLSPRLSFKNGESIREIQEKKEYNQEQLDEIMKVSRTTISKIENGKFNCSIDYLSKFSWFLGFEIKIK
jgi:DNA-binding XRE family transcriptional regulator